MDGAIPEAIWTECCDPIEELESAFTGTEIDCYKVAGYVPVCNAMLEDSFINLANYLENRIAQGIAKALDKAILTGPEADNMPTGIIPLIPAANQVGIDSDLADIIKSMAIIDDGEDKASGLGDVIAVMTRKTYYEHIATKSLAFTAAGQYISQNAVNPHLPDGTRIVFSKYVADNDIILGSFKAYLLGERAGVKLESSREVRFIEDETVFKGTARYDGKPVYPEAFAKLTIS